MAQSPGCSLQSRRVTWQDEKIIEMKKRLLLFFTALITLIVIVLTAAGIYMLNFSLKPAHNKGRDEQVMYRKMFAEFPQDKPWVDSLRAAGALHDTIVVAADGDRHHAVYIRAARKTARTAMLIHGYTDCYVNMLAIGKIYADMGYNLFLPELHGNGKSEGHEEQMGWKDRRDIRQWMDVARKVFGDSLRMVVHGVSMGAATTMCVSGDTTPSFVKCFVEDCGYTSVWDEFSHELKNQFGLPPFPLMYTTSALCKLRYGWTFGQASPLRQVAKCRKPMLFIHGDADDFVPSWMVWPLYKAKPQPKDIFIANGSKHAKSYHDHPVAYRNKVVGFVSKYIR